MALPTLFLKFKIVLNLDNVLTLTVGRYYYFLQISVKKMKKIMSHCWKSGEQNYRGCPPGVTRFSNPRKLHNDTIYNINHRKLLFQELLKKMEKLTVRLKRSNNIDGNRKLFLRPWVQGVTKVVVFKCFVRALVMMMILLTGGVDSSAQLRWDKWKGLGSAERGTCTSTNIPILAQLSIIYPSFNLSIYPSIYQSIYPSIYLSIHLTSYPSIYLAIYLPIQRQV